MKTLWFIREYPKLKEKYDNLLGQSPAMDGQPRGTGIGDPTGRVAAQSAELSLQLMAIKDGLRAIPEEYQRHIFLNIVDRVPFPDYANRKTWKKWKQRYVYAVALRMNWS